MWKNFVQPGRRQVTIWRMRFARWIAGYKYTHSRCVMLIAFPLQHSLHARSPLLRCTHTTLPVLLPIASQETVFLTKVERA
jgi:hypothetical protein